MSLHEIALFRSHRSDSSIRYAMNVEAPGKSRAPSPGPWIAYIAVMLEHLFGIGDRALAETTKHDDG